MTKSAMIRARIEPELKSEAEQVLKKLGISTTDLITMTMRQVVMRQGVPFDVRIPNAETVAAIEEMQHEKAKGSLKGYEKPDALFQAMRNEAALADDD